MSNPEYGRDGFEFTHVLVKDGKNICVFPGVYIVLRWKSR